MVFYRVRVNRDRRQIISKLASCGEAHHRRSQPSDVIAARLTVSVLARAPPPTPVVPLPAGIFLHPVLRLHSWREGGIAAVVLPSSPLSLSLLLLYHFWRRGNLIAGSEGLPSIDAPLAAAPYNTPLEQ